MGNKDKNAAKSKLAVVAAAGAMVIIGFALSLVTQNVSSPIDFRRLLTQKPGGAVMLAGFVLVLLSAVTLVFRRQMGAWAARFRRWVADFFPAWKQLSGLPDEQAERYLTPDFGRKMIVVAAAIDLCVGFCLIGVGLMLNMTR